MDYLAKGWDLDLIVAKSEINPRYPDSVVAALTR
jgi:hypothetical protein